MNKLDNSLLDLRRVSAGLLALAVKRLFPRVCLVGGGATVVGFYYDFLFPSSFQDDCIPRIEETMRDWIRRKFPVEVKEMVPVSAKGYFISCKEPFLAETAACSSSSTLFLLEIDGDRILTDGAVEIDCADKIGAFKLGKWEETEVQGERKRVIRICGAVFPDKQQLKAFLKSGNWGIQPSHQVTGRRLRLFREEDGGWLWLPKGQALFEILRNFLIEEDREFYPVSSVPLCEEINEKDFFTSGEKIFNEMGEVEVLRIGECSTVSGSDDKVAAAGLLDSGFFRCRISRVFCEEKHLLGEVISSLHFRAGIFKILGFDFRIVFSERRKMPGNRSDVLLKALRESSYEYSREKASTEVGSSRIEWLVRDGLGREWPVACVASPRPIKKKGFFGFFGSTCLSFERLTALVVEKSGGVFPFWMTPEQVRVLAVREKHKPKAEAITKELREAGFRVRFGRSDGELRDRVREAVEEGVAYVVLTGDREAEVDAIVLKDLRGREEKALSIEETVEYLRSILKGSYCSGLQD